MPGPRSPLATALAAVTLLLALALAACGDDEQSTVTETITEAEPTSSATSSTTSGAEATAGSEGSDGAPPPADITVDESAAFETPTGNIGCFIDKVTVRCDIAERDWKPPAPPASCELDYGQGITLAAGGGSELVCAGDTVLGSGGETLEYGQAISSGLLRCESEEEGLRCEDTENGRGFFLSRAGYELF